MRNVESIEDTIKEYRDIILKYPLDDWAIWLNYYHYVIQGISFSNEIVRMNEKKDPIKAKNYQREASVYLAFKAEMEALNPGLIAAEDRFRKEEEKKRK